MAEQFMSDHSNINKSIFESMNSISQSILNTTMENMQDVDANAAATTSVPKSNIPFTYKSACIELFNKAFNAYKQHNNQDQKVRSIGREQYPDYEIFCDISTGIEILRGFIGYAVWRHLSNWDELCKQHSITTVQQLLDSEIKIPQNDNELIALFTAYPWAIDDLHVELFSIINLDTFEFMLKLCKINKLLYFNTFPEPEDAEPILECEKDTMELWVIIKTLAKKLLKYHIEIAKIVEKSADPASSPKDTAMDVDSCPMGETATHVDTAAMDVDAVPEINQEPPAKIRKISAE